MAAPYCYILFGNILDINVKGEKLDMNRKLAVICSIVVLIVTIAVESAFATNFIRMKIQTKKEDSRNIEQLKFEKSEHLVQRYESKKGNTPEAVLQAYFDTLGKAANLTETQMGAVGGSIERGLQPYEIAYQYWCKDWQQKNSYEQFLTSWEGTVHVELLKLLPAGEENDKKKFFVETRHIEVTRHEPRAGIFYYIGFFTVDKTGKGWCITGGNLEPQNLAWALGGHQPWRADPIMVALVEGLGVSIETDMGEPVVENNPDGTVTVKFLDIHSRQLHSIVLYLPKDGMWRVL